MEWLRKNYVCSVERKDSVPRARIKFSIVRAFAHQTITVTARYISSVCQFNIMYSVLNETDSPGRCVIQLQLTSYVPAPLCIRMYIGTKLFQKLTTQALFFIHSKYVKNDIKCRIDSVIDTRQLSYRLIRYFVTFSCLKADRIKISHIARFNWQ